GLVVVWGGVVLCGGGSGGRLAALLLGADEVVVDGQPLGGLVGTAVLAGRLGHHLGRDVAGPHRVFVLARPPGRRGRGTCAGTRGGRRPRLHGRRRVRGSADRGRG